MITKKYYVSGMHCASCKAIIENALNKNDFIDNASVNFGSETMSVTYDEKKLIDNDITEIVKSAGDYNVKPLDNLSHEHYKKEKGFTVTKMKKNVVITAFLMAPFIIEMIFMLLGYLVKLDISFMQITEFIQINFFGLSWFVLVQILFSGFILFFSGRLFFVNAFIAAKKMASNMDTLVVLGATSAWTYSTFASLFINKGGDVYPVFFEASAFIVFFILLGRYFEEKSRWATQKSVEGLHAVQSKFAIILDKGKELEIPIEQVSVGDRVVVKSGQKIPIDGIVEEGNSSIDESTITGESMPVEKKSGDKVIGGTLNTTGYIIVRATSVGSETMLSQIIRMVEEAQGTSVPIQKMADKISSIFVPIVILIAVITFIFWYFFAPGFNLINSNLAFSFSMYVSISVLVIACPCALGLATPTAIVVSIGAAARRGVLIKNAQIIENAYKIKHIIFDKTGTITSGMPKVSDAVYFGDEELCDSYVFTLETKTEHPVAHAIVNYIEGKNKSIKSKKLENFQNMGGVGVKGFLDKKEMVIAKSGSIIKYKNFSDVQKTVIEKFINQKYTVSLFSVEGEVKAIYGVSDPIKQTSKKAVETLNKKGINMIMVTGDHKDVADKVANEVGIEHVVSDANPLDKDKIVQKMKLEAGKDNLIAVAGDGINDAPALARSDIGIAMGTGSDVAIESGDIVIVKGSLQKIVDTINLSQRTMRIIKQNLFWAFGYNVLAIPIAFGILYPFFGITLSPIIASAAMAFSSVSVVLNSLRLRK